MLDRIDLEHEEELYLAVLKELSRIFYLIQHYYNSLNIRVVGGEKYQDVPYIFNTLKGSHQSEDFFNYLMKGEQRIPAKVREEVHKHEVLLYNKVTGLYTLKLPIVIRKRGKAKREYGLAAIFIDKKDLHNFKVTHCKITTFGEEAQESHSKLRYKQSITYQYVEEEVLAPYQAKPNPAKEATRTEKTTNVKGDDEMARRKVSEIVEKAATKLDETTEKISEVMDDKSEELMQGASAVAGKVGDKFIEMKDGERVKAKRRRLTTDEKIEQLKAQIAELEAKKASEEEMRKREEDEALAAKREELKNQIEVEKQAIEEHRKRIAELKAELDNISPYRMRVRAMKAEQAAKAKAKEEAEAEQTAKENSAKEPDIGATD